MRQKVLEYIKKNCMIKSDDTIIVGVSGGADSVCLLLMLKSMQRELGISLVAVHINHQLRNEADEDEAYVKKLCQEMEIPLYTVSVDVKKRAKESRMSCEEAGRELRYTAFYEAAEKYTDRKNFKIAVAHHADDRAETVMFHLFRGSGLKGLAGILPVRENIIRPLLCVTRKEIESYLLEKKIAYCIDKTNDEDDFTRNKIRHHILPFAEEKICRGSTRHIVHAADIILETEEFLEELTTECMAECVTEIDGSRGKKILLSVFLRQKKLLQKRILFKVLESVQAYRRDITSSHVDSILEIMEKDGSKEVHLPHDILIKKEYGVCYIFIQRGEEKKPGYDKEISNLGMFQIEKDKSLFLERVSYDKREIIPQKTYTKWFDYDRIEKSLRLRTRLPGDYIMVNEGKAKKRLKEYMIEEKIPKAVRDEIYLLADGQHILWIIGYRISEYYKITENTKTILKAQWNI